MAELAQPTSELNRSVSVLNQAVSSLATEMGGLSRSMSYALENEAYRVLPAFLKAHHGIELSGRLLRKEIRGKEVNLFAHGVCVREGQPVIVVGETKLQLDERRSNRGAAEVVLAQLADKVEAVRAENGSVEIVPLLITHYARPAFLSQAHAKGILVVQSFEW